MDEEKLVEILKESDVRISNKGNICLNDFVENIIESKNSNVYIKKLTNYNKIIIKDEFYIKPDDCIDLLKKSNFKRCKDIYTKIQIVDDNDENIIDVENQIFQFEGHKFVAFFNKKDEDDWDVWIKGSEVAKVLGYVDDKQAIRDHVDDDNKVSFGDFDKIFPMVEKTIPTKMDKKTIFINLSGFLNLIHCSKKPFAKKIKKWLDNDVVPALLKYGTYTMQPSNLKLKFFYDESAISDFDKKAVVYIAYVGKYKDEYIFKYGLSRNMFSRDYEQHRKLFDKFKVIFVGECDNCEHVEDLFEKELKVRNLYRKLVINNKPQTELFTITTKFMHDFFTDLMQKLISDHKLPAIKDADAKIINLCNVVDTYKQSDEIKKLEIQFKLSDNYRLELEKDIRIKEIDFKIEKEKSKQVAMEKGYDLTNLQDIITKPKKKQEIYVL